MRAVTTKDKRVEGLWDSFTFIALPRNSCIYFISEFLVIGDVHTKRSSLSLWNVVLLIQATFSY